MKTKTKLSIFLLHRYVLKKIRNQWSPDTKPYEKWRQFSSVEDGLQSDTTDWLRDLLLMIFIMYVKRFGPLQLGVCLRSISSNAQMSTIKSKLKTKHEPKTADKKENYLGLDEAEVQKSWEFMSMRRLM